MRYIDEGYSLLRGDCDPALRVSRNRPLLLPPRARAVRRADSYKRPAGVFCRMRLHSWLECRKETHHHTLERVRRSPAGHLLKVHVPRKLPNSVPPLSVGRRSQT